MGAKTAAAFTPSVPSKYGVPELLRLRSAYGSRQQFSKTFLRRHLTLRGEVPLLVICTRLCRLRFRDSVCVVFFRRPRPVVQVRRNLGAGHALPRRRSVGRLCIAAVLYSDFGPADQIEVR